jgi:hypothetical protein
METVNRLAQLLRERNQIDRQISALIGRPATQGHLGEFLAAKIFDIELMELANNKAIDGVFRSGALAGKSVDIKFYGKQEGLLAINEILQPDYFLVLTGQRLAAASSKGKCRLCVIDHVYLFEGKSLATALRAGGRKFGVAASVRSAFWEAAEIYPLQKNETLTVSDQQRDLLRLFASE